MTENSDSPVDDVLDPRTAALAAAVLEVGRHVGEAPLRSPHWFALVATGELLASQPAFALLLDDAAREAAASDPHHLTPIELDDVPGAADPLSALERLEAPDIADGLALACDLDAVRAAEGSAARTRERLGTGPVRAVIAALSDGTTWCSVRGAGRREQALGRRLVPDLVDALAQAVGAPSADGGDEKA